MLSFRAVRALRVVTLRFRITNCAASGWGEDRHLQMLEVFHSHPSGDRRLSAADHAALRHSEWPWLIVTRSYECDTPVVLAGYRPGDASPMEVRIESPHEHQY